MTLNVNYCSVIIVVCGVSVSNRLVLESRGFRYKVALPQLSAY